MSFHATRHLGLHKINLVSFKYVLGEKIEKNVSARYIHRLLDIVQEEIKTSGDKDWLFDCQKNQYSKVDY